MVMSLSAAGKRGWNMEKLTFSRYKYCIILILSGKKYDLNTVVYVVALLYSGIASLWSACAISITIIKNILEKLNCFLQTYVIS